MITAKIILKRSNFNISINETFHEGITGIFGPSGSGKTSIFNAIAGLARPERGFISIRERVVFDSEENINVAVHKRHIGYVFQSGRLFPHMNVEKNLIFGMNNRKAQLLNFEEVVAILKLEHVLKSKPAVISGGEYQRTALGRALLSSPDILLLDEPFSAVDTCLRNQIIPYLLKLQQRIHLPMLIVSHQLSALLSLTKRLCIIRDGKCIGHGEYPDLIQSK